MIAEGIAGLEKLTKQIRDIELSGKRAWVGRRILSGCTEVDRLLPAGGYASGSLVEWLFDGAGVGAKWLALQVAKHAIEGGRYLVVIDPNRSFYPMGAVSMGIPLERILVLQPTHASDVLWSIDQSLRNTAVGAVLADLDRLEDREARRLQLAAEHGGGLGLFMRPSRFARGIPSWAEVQWHVQTRAWPSTGQRNQRRLDLQLLRCRGGRVGASISVVLDGVSGGILRCEHSPLRSPNETVKHSVNQSSQEGLHHASKSALCLAAELAMPAHPSKRSIAAGTSIRAAGA